MLKRKTKSRREPNLNGRTPLTYYRSGPADSPSPFKKSEPAKKKRNRSGRVVDWAIITAALALAVYVLSLNASPKVETSSTAYRPLSVYAKAADEITDGLKYRSKLTFDEKALNDELRGRFPEISSVSADLSLFGRTPKLHIKVAEPSLKFEGTKGTFGANSSMIVDAKGTVVGPAADFPDIKNLPPIQDDTGFGARTGESALSRSDVDFILTLIAQAKKAKVPIKSLTFPRSAQELDMRTQDRPYFVKFYLGGDPVLQSGQFLSARHRFDETKKQPSQYLDARVSGKIYYK